MRLTVLGTGTIAFSPQRSCAGYFVEAGSAKLLMDCGAGTTRRLAELAIPWQELTHVAPTHFQASICGTHHAHLRREVRMPSPRTAPFRSSARGAEDLLRRRRPVWRMSPLPDTDPIIRD